MRLISKPDRLLAFHNSRPLAGFSETVQATLILTSNRLDKADSSAAMPVHVFRLALASERLHADHVALRKALTADGGRNLRLSSGRPGSRDSCSLPCQRLAATPSEDRFRVFSTAPIARPITLLDLLSHSLGIAYGDGNDGIGAAYRAAGFDTGPLNHRDEPIAAIVDKLAALPLAAQPGERFIYSFSTDVLGAVVEKVSGMSLEEFFQRRIFQPLGMNDSSFYLPRTKIGRPESATRARAISMLHVFQHRLRVPQEGPAELKSPNRKQFRKSAQSSVQFSSGRVVLRKSLAAAARWQVRAGRVGLNLRVLPGGSIRRELSLP